MAVENIGNGLIMVSHSYNENGMRGKGFTVFTEHDYNLFLQNGLKKMGGDVLEDRIVNEQRN